jgi:PAS domain S-box-containing protein
MDPGWHSERWRQFLAGLLPGQMRTLEVSHTRKDGSSFPTEVCLTLFELDGAQVVLGIVRDITVRREVEERLRASEERFRGLLENAGDGIVILDAEGQVRDVNQRICSYLGYSREEMLGLGAWDFVVGLTRNGFRDFFDHVNQMSPITRDGAHRRKDGTIYPTEVRICTLEFEGRWWMLALVRDVTERKRMEQQLREGEERLARTLDSAMDAILVFDDQRRLSFLNPAAQKIFDCSACDLVGESLDSVLSDPLIAVIESYLRTSDKPNEHGSFWAPEGMRARRRNGDEFPAEFTISSFELSGKRLHTMILRDVNQRAEAEAALRKLSLEKAYLQQELTRQYNVHNIVGSSGALQDVFRSVEQVASTDSTVLLTGQTGTGKELIARAIHDASQRRDQVLVTVNCAALPAGLIESELFGHEKGAFTGALSRRIGRFETADHGTLFLDEIGDLPFDMQAKLLRVLQEREIERVGGVGPIRVDVRVIAATNRNLEDAVAQRAFRSDLFYRLNVFPIHLPPLRDR